MTSVIGRPAACSATGGEVLQEHQPAGLAWWAGWGLVMRGDVRWQHLSTARREPVRRVLTCRRDDVDATITGRSRKPSQADHGGPLKVSAVPARIGAFLVLSPCGSPRCARSSTTWRCPFTRATRRGCSAAPLRPAHPAAARSSSPRADSARWSHSPWSPTDS